jgi:autotransporter-associated beta strand protein
VANTRTVLLLNGGVSNAVWSGNVLLTNTTAVGFRAGGTNGAEVEISGIISGGSGNSVQSQDNGTLRLSGANTYDGLTSVRNGSTLIVGNASALGSTTSGTTINNAANTTLDLNGFNVGNEAITLVGANSRVVNNNTSSAATVAGSITTTNGQIGGSGNLTASGVISSATASGFTKVGTGTVTLSGNNTYTGTTTVSAGSLIVNGNQSGATGVLTVAANATLGGSGTIGGPTTISGILAPGNSIGTLTVANDVTWNSGNSWVFELGAVAGPSILSPGSSDLLAITGGNDFLKGGVGPFTFDFAGTGDFGWYKLVDWAGGSTTFDVLDFTGVNLGGVYTSEFAIQDNALYVNVVPEPSTYALLALAAAGLGSHVIRRRRRA